MKKARAGLARRLLPLLLFLILPAAGALACEFTYTLKAPDGSRTTLRPGTGIVLELGGSYELEITFTEDHGRCLLTPEDTDLFLQEVKWKPGRDLPLLLTGPYAWEDTDPRSHRAVLSFRALEAGSFELEVLRECSKGGYDELLRFTVSA